MSLTFGLNGLKNIEGEGQGVGNAGNDEGLNAETFTQGVYLVPEQIERDEKFRGGVAEVVGQFLFHVEGIGHDHCCARLERAPEGNDGLGQIGQHDGHPVARIQSMFSQRGGKGFRLVFELPVGDGEILEDDGLVVAETVGSFVQIGLEGTGNNVEVHGRALGNVGQPCGSRGVHEAYPWLE